MQFETDVEVTTAHTDSLGHLNHVEAVRFMERGRDDWLGACGLYDSDIRYASVVVNINYSYRLECFEGEHLKVVSQPQSMGTKSYTLTHEIIKPGGTITISGVATSVIMNMSERSIVPVPECMARYLPARESRSPG